MGRDSASEIELTVVIPCFNVASTLGEQLDALMAQEWTGSWEIVVVDNGSTDETADIARSYAAGAVPVRVVEADERRGVAYARNAGIAAARSSSIAICDGDDVVQPGWVAAMGAALHEHPLVGGLVDPTLVNEPWLARTRPMGSGDALPRFGGWTFVSGGNCGMWRSVWERLGGYDEAFRGLEDIEFSLRARSIGIEPTFARQAVVGYRYREGLGPLWRQGFYYGRGRRELSVRARASGLSGTSRMAGIKAWLWLTVHLPDLRSRSGRYSWIWVLANRAGAARGLLGPGHGLASGDQGEETQDLVHSPPSAGRLHGVLITFRRSDDLAASLTALAGQTVKLDSLTVVDNDADPRIQELVMNTPSGTPEVRYLAEPANMGPAGGIHAGVSDVLRRAADGDWVVLFDDDDPPQRADTLERLRDKLDEVHQGDPACGGMGLWGALLKSRTGRLRAATANVPERVDYLPGGACPHYSVEMLRKTGLPSPELFFGFDDLDLGLRVRSAGRRLYSSGLAREHGLTHMVDGRRAALAARPPTWRRYYSLRNLVIVLREHDETWGAIVMSALSGVIKPMLNSLHDPGIAIANLRLNYRALRDGWTGRSGKAIDPAMLTDDVTRAEGGSG